MVLTAPDGTFATGVCEYWDSCPGLAEPLPRVYIPFQPEGAETWFLALLDTGGHFCILSTEVADTIRGGLTHTVQRTSLVTAQGRIQGQLYRHRIELVAQEGEDFGVEATVLVSSDWRGPSVLGYTGMLDRMRCALDPQTNRFFFGPLWSG